MLSVDAANEGRVRVDFIVLQEPDLVRIQNLREVTFIILKSTHVVCDLQMLMGTMKCLSLIIMY